MAALKPLRRPASSATCREVDNRVIRMTTPPDIAGSDPKPQPPEKPLPAECCESGCAMCVYDVYADQLEAYEAALKAWKARHPDAVE
jgi:hypothetical protein